MRVCKNCNYTTDAAINFCPQCGGQMAAIQPEPQPQPVYTVTAVPVTYPAYEDNKPSLGKKIVGMILGIVGFVFSLISILYTLMFAALQPEAGIFFSIYLGAFSMPLSCVGLGLSKSCRDAGDTSGMTSTGKALGLAGLIVSCVAIFISFIALASY